MIGGTGARHPCRHPGRFSSSPSWPNLELSAVHNHSGIIMLNRLIDWSEPRLLVVLALLGVLSAPRSAHPPT